MKSICCVLTSQHNRAQWTINNSLAANVHQGIKKCHKLATEYAVSSSIILPDVVTRHSVSRIIDPHLQFLPSHH